MAQLSPHPDDVWDSQYDFEDGEEIVPESKLVDFEDGDYDAGNIPPCTNEDAVSFIASMGFRSKGVRVGQWKHAPGKPYVFMVAKIGTSLSRIGPQHAALEFSSYMKMPYCFQYIYAAQRSPGKILNRYTYVVFSTIRDVLSFVNSSSRRLFNKCPLFEVIQERQCRVHLDIDYKISKEKAEDIELKHNEHGQGKPLMDLADAIALHCRVALECVLREQFQIDSERARYIVVLQDTRHDRNEAFKASFHLIVPFVLVSVNTHRIMKELANDVQDYLDQSKSLADFFHDCLLPFPAPLVDTVIYTRNRLFRCFKCSKSSDLVLDLLMGVTGKFTQNAASSSFSLPENAQFCLSLVSVPAASWDTSKYAVLCVDTDTKLTTNVGNLPEHQLEELAENEAGVVSYSVRSLPVPRVESLAAIHWAQRYHESRSVKFDQVASTVFTPGELTMSAQGTVIFVQVPTDKYCEMKGRVHVGDTNGTQTCYAVDLLTSEVKQRCHSCRPNATPPAKMSIYVPDYDLFKILTSGNHVKIVSAIREEFCRGEHAFVVVCNATEKGGVWVWNEHFSGDGYYNHGKGDTCLWAEGGVGYLTAAIVVPFLQRKFALLQSSITSEDMLELLQKKESHIMKQATLSSLTTLMKRIVNQRKDTDDFESQINTSSPTLIPTNDRCCVDLLTGSTILRTPEQRFSIECPFKLLDLDTTDGKERFKRMHTFVSSIMGGDAEKAAYIQKIYGYSITGDHRDRKYYCHLGCGRNGKTSLDEVIAAAIGDFHKTVRSDFVVQSDGGMSSSSNASPDTMALKYARLVSCAETPQGARMNIERMKLMASGDKMSGRQLYKEETNFVLPGKIHIQSNFACRIDAQDVAATDRQVVVNYNSRFVFDEPREEYNEYKADNSIVTALRDDHDAVGTWLAQGAQRALQELDASGMITIPNSVKLDTAAELEKIDTIKAFFTTKAQIHPLASVEKVQSKQVASWSWEQATAFTSFKLYVQARGSSTKWDMARFNACSERYFKNNRLNVQSGEYGNAYFWYGIRPKEEESDVLDGPFAKRQRISADADV